MFSWMQHLLIDGHANLAVIKQVEAIYTRYAPQKSYKVDGLLTRFAGDEDRLLRLVRRKYVDVGESAV